MSRKHIDPSQLIKRIGELQGKVSRLEHKLADELSQCKLRFENKASPFKQELAELQDTLQTWATNNRTKLLSGNAKAAKFATGEIGWRMGTRTVHIQYPEQVLDDLWQGGLDAYIRVKEEINKEAILANPEGVKGIRGISITRKETFYIKPLGVDRIAGGDK